MQEYKLKIKDFPIDERPRERLIKAGPKPLSDAELLAVILRTGNKKENVLELAKRLINEYNLKTLSRIRVNSLKKIFGIGEAKACQIIACFEIGRRTACLKNGRCKKINSAKDIANRLMAELSNLKKEYFIGIFLDSRKKIIKKETIFIGSLDSSIIHPREIFKIALAESAAAVILIHNHPSGDPIPSQEDIEITKQIIKAGEIIGIQVLDHIIIGDRKYISLKEKEYC
jgi:DNA repair protein RadC